jgi:nicotinate-nucleotide adenylyltransferase
MELRAIHGPDAELFFITGADAVLDILTWKDSERLADACTFIAATRPGHDLTEFSGHADAARLRVEFMAVPALAISSTDIRARIAERRPVRYLLPEAVAAYAEKNGLYRATL